MKKNLALVLAAAMTAGCLFTGCGSKAEETAAAADTADATEKARR